MTTIERLAREAGIPMWTLTDANAEAVVLKLESLTKFYTLVRNEALEHAAATIDANWYRDQSQISLAIRAMKKESAT
jgi:hypothetical protein